MSIKAERIADSLIEQISYAKIYYTVLDESQKDKTAAALKSASGFIRHELRERIDIRQIPELKFIYDESIEYGNKIEEKLKEINDNQ